jgi:GMP reductase
MFRHKIDTIKKLDFSDVLVVPKKTTLSSRSNVVVTRSITFKHSKKDWHGIPIISSNMDTVTNVDTFNALRKRHMLSCFPKYFNQQWLDGDLPVELDDVNHYMISSGIKSVDVNTLFGLIAKLADNNITPKFLCFDVANGYMIDLIKTCQQVRKKLPDVTLMAGNVVTPDGVKDLVVDGMVDIVKIGIGSGLLCTTRKITGVGYPQFSAVLECAQKAHDLGAHVVSDGGVTVVGDIAKALCAGADFVMLGSLIAGHDISPGDVIYDNGKMFKIAYGMSSSVANEKYAGGLSDYKAPEGKVVKIALRGKLDDTLQRIEGGIRSNCTYIGARDIQSMPKNSTFITVNRQYNDALDRMVIDE